AQHGQSRRPRHHRDEADQRRRRDAQANPARQPPEPRVEVQGRAPPLGVRSRAPCRHRPPLYRRWTPSVPWGAAPGRADLQCDSMTPALPKLPTSVVGSHGLPGWVWLAREAMEAGRLGRVDVRELMEDATQAAILDQERAGVDVVSTGEMMRVRFIVGFYDRLSG